MLKPPLWKSSGGTIYAIAGGGDKGVYTFPKSISPKVNVMKLVEF